MWALIKSKAVAYGAAIFAFIAMVVSVLFVRGSRWKKIAKQNKRQLDFEREVEESESEIEQEFSHRAEEANKDLENEVIPDHLRNP